MDVLWFILDGFSPFNVQKFLHKIGAAGGVGVEAGHWSYLQVQSTERFQLQSSLPTHGLWEVSLPSLASYAIC